MTNKKQIKSEKGITLIVLAVTVLVMLILSGVAIKVAVGDEGLISRAEDATDRYQSAQEGEVDNLNRVDEKYHKVLDRVGGKDIEEIPLPDTIPTTTPTPTTSPTPVPTPTNTPNIPAKPGKPDENGIYTENSTINGKEGNAFNPEVPKGFKPVDVDDAVWGDGSTPPTEDAVKKGLVIEDEEGNQFVWIAVDGTEVKLGRYVFTSTGAIDENLSKTEPADQLKLSASDTAYFTEGLKEDTTLNAHARDIQAFRTSVANHGGYYIARYEASYGIDGKPNSKISTGTPNKKHGVAYAPTQEGQLWNNITQLDASTACQNMYDSNYGATSDLVNSYAWDTAILFIQKYSGDTDYSRQTSLNTALANTGINKDERCHVHDMASNCYEWTTETGSGFLNPCVARGGYYAGDYRNSYTSVRGIHNVSGTVSHLAFRPLLYL